MTEGMDFTDNVETLTKFESLIVETGIVSEKHAGITERYQEDPEKADSAKAKATLEESQALVDECLKANDKMQSDKSLRIRVGSKGNVPGRALRQGSADAAALASLSICWESNAPSTMSKPNSSWRPCNRVNALRFFWTTVNPPRTFPGASRMMDINYCPMWKKTDTTKSSLKKHNKGSRRNA